MYQSRLFSFSNTKIRRQNSPVYPKLATGYRTSRVQGRRTRSGRSGPDPTNYFAFFFFFFFFLSFEANGFARGLKLNEIEHYKLNESKGRCPRETFFVSRFSPAFPHARRRHPSLRYNFSRHLLSIFHVIYSI